jgi:hypothetical protein
MKLIRTALMIAFAVLYATTTAVAQSGRTLQSPTSTQSPSLQCALTRASAPALLGFRLGMTKEELLQRLPGLQVTAANELGVSTVSVKGRDLGVASNNTSEFEQVENVTMELTDNRLTYIRLGYAGTTKWKSADEFVSRAAGWLKVSGEWKHFYDLSNKTFRDTEDFRAQAIECDGLRLSVGIGVEGVSQQMPHIKLEDMAASGVVEEREAAKARREAEQKQKSSP